METKLKAYFPLIREREEILAEIRGKAALQDQFRSWGGERQEEFLNFCTGVKGVRVLYDAFFRELMNPETSPERLEDFLSLVLKKNVRIFCVLPNDAVRIADESSLLVTDIVVQLEDGSLANVEIQKIGYLFPGERSACYSADLLLRQYKRVRGEKKKTFSYKDIKSVYTVVLFERSPKAFRSFPEVFLHCFEQRSDSGLELELLQKYIFVPLDIFHGKMHNKTVGNRLEAWLMFFSTDDPEDIICLIEKYPEFQPLYGQLYEICRNVEKIMGIFSEELLMLDRNTVQYMIDEMQDTIDEQAAALEQKAAVLEQREATIEQQRRELEEERQQKLLLLIIQTRKLMETGMSAEKCADMLAADAGLVQAICREVKKHPEAEAEEICRQLKQEGVGERN